MAPGRVRGWRLTPAARADLGAIWDFTASRWSPDRADAYLLGLDATLGLLCEHPEMGRERAEIAPPVRLHPYRAHVILYRIEGDHLAVLRVAHGRRNWRALLED